MKKIYFGFLLTAFLISAACGGSKPNVPAVPLTAPWVSMNLPCKGQAVVVVSRLPLPLMVPLNF